MKDDYQKNAATPLAALARLTHAVWALENAKPYLIQILQAGHTHPFFGTLQAEMRNLAYVLQSLPIERDSKGYPLHARDCTRGKRGVQ